jgi:uncharacterized protein with HEPN domain
MNANDRNLLGHILTHAQYIQMAVAKHTEESASQDLVLQAALRYWLQVIGESANHISEDTQLLLPQIPWRQLIGMRHRLVHNYTGIDDLVI